jgi:magnesium chelatase family protein
MTSEAVKQYCKLDNDSTQLIKNAVNQMQLSARAYFRILKLARTIADLSKEEKILLPHIAEALQYRPKME